MGEGEDREGSEEEEEEEEILSEVFVSEVLANLSAAGEREVTVGGGGVSGRGEGGWSTSGSSPWKMLS